MFQKFKPTDFLLFFLFSSSHPMLEISQNLNLPNEMWSKILNCCVYDNDQKALPDKRINDFHCDTDQEQKYRNYLKNAISLFLVSKFFQPIMHEHLQNLLSPEKMFIYEINTNKPFLPFLSHLYYEPLDETTKTHCIVQRDIERVVFKTIQWFCFHKNITAQLKKQPSKAKFLRIASSNALAYSASIMYEALSKRLNNIHPKQPINFNSKLLDIYSKFKKKMTQNYFAIGWLDHYIQNNGEIPPRSQSILVPTLTPYTTNEFEQLTIFLNQHSQFCLDNVGNIFSFLDNENELGKQFPYCHKEGFKIYFIMRFLIVLHATQDTSYQFQGSRKLYKLLSKLSADYWYNPL